MATGKIDKAAQLQALPVRPDEDPFVVAIGGFYRRWFNLVDDLQPMLDTVAKLKGTEDEDWVPAWSAVAAPYEKEAEAALKRGDKAAARNAVPAGEDVLQPRALSRALPLGLADLSAEHEPAQGAVLPALPRMLPARDRTARDAA